jgi:DNA-binding NtrC family response regulator
MVQKISLVVDDEASIRKYVSAILQLEHFQTLEAENGCLGLQIVCDLGNDLELVVSDIQMPNCDGLTLAHAVKEAFPAVPVILISGGQNRIPSLTVSSETIPATCSAGNRPLHP